MKNFEGRKVRLFGVILKGRLGIGGSPERTLVLGEGKICLLRMLRKVFFPKT